MDLPTTLSKFIIQQDEETFYNLYSESIESIGNMLIHFQNLRIYNYEIEHNTIFINSKVYDQLIRECFKNN